MGLLLIVKSASCNHEESISLNLENPLAKKKAPAPMSPPKPFHLPMSDLLEDDDLTSALKKCPEWELEKNAITRTVEFEEFMDAIDFVNDLAEIAEEAQHHPVVTINYTKVSLKLTTHDAGGITDLDIELAQRLDNLVD
jgi:4a-hydroxytetrahydrobiopterin dehydratase